EVIYAPSNYLYSHSYIFNFGIPFKHTGVWTTTHVNDQLDVHVCAVVGINTGSFDDNNNAWSLHSGFMWKDAAEDEHLTINGSLHIGAEDPHDNDHKRYIASMQTTLKLSENLTALTDYNWG